MSETKTVEVKPGQIERTLLELADLEEKIQGAKDILRHFKIKSDRLDQLKTAHKELKEQIDEEKNRIEQGFLEDADYEQAMNESLDLKPKIKDKKTQLRELMASANKNQELSTHEFNVKGEPVKIQVQRVVKVYINGKEQK